MGGDSRGRPDFQLENTRTIAAPHCGMLIQCNATHINCTLYLHLTHPLGRPGSFKSQEDLADVNDHLAIGTGITGASTFAADQQLLVWKLWVTPASALYNCR